MYSSVSTVDVFHEVVLRITYVAAVPLAKHFSGSRSAKVENCGSIHDFLKVHISSEDVIE